MGDYRVEQRPDGLWVVVDRYSGWPVEIGDGIAWADRWPTREAAEAARESVEFAHA